jgi:hypothetical protein
MSVGLENTEGVVDDIELRSGKSAPVEEPHEYWILADVVYFGRRGDTACPRQAA